MPTIHGLISEGLEHDVDGVDLFRVSSTLKKDQYSGKQGIMQLL